MARAGPVLNTIPANPYQPAKDIQPVNTECETCKRVIPTKHWGEHARSKKHQKAVDEQRRAKDKENNAGYDNYSGQGEAVADAAADQGASWASSDPVDNGFASAPSGGGRGACYGCGEIGHNKRDCPQFSGGNGGGGRACYGCGKEGHQKRDCPEGSNARACYNCGLPGHTKANCDKDPQSGRNGGGDGQQCFNCQLFGHRRADCPNERVMKCRNCEEIGHMSRECPKPKDWSKHQCSNCKEFGHGPKRCPHPVAEDTNGGSWGDAGATTAATGGWDNTDAGANAESSGDWAGDAAPPGDNWGGAEAGAGW